MELRRERFAVAAALLLAGALFGILFAVSFQSRQRTIPAGAGGPPAPLVFGLTQGFPSKMTLVVPPASAGRIGVITQTPPQQVRRSRPIRVEREFLYDAVLPEDLWRLSEPWRRRGYYDLIDFRYKPELPSKELP